ncbi:oligogalacturonide ABC transporter membrane protein [Hydrogenispora ethanolica]|jgi:oligogalacturonide transport system permease protein|uniref:Oligogalacturonide ABC transporter membrane protein n=1 Tax=Hydrogenispora ethanolica TaxID=1082276 RepID=A0A4R1RUG4_HYDET|nr:carbohydrate ABC transporter permease [Hydrogenispora ethanolica]TCL70024.1 oligogalacturonide ABC transporter membrane protein [Hydrogenispora ethanolica]
MQKKIVATATTYILISLLGLLMIYPLLWLVSGSFKSNAEIFNSFQLIPSRINFDAYIRGWVGLGQQTYSNFFINTIKMVVPSVFFCLLSSFLTAYGFSRFRFPFKKPLFALMIATLMLPKTVIIIPRYMIFKNLGWLDTFLPFYAPELLATQSFFIFMLVQFMRGLPRELDESAEIDGCNSFQILYRILLPLAKPALFSAAIFDFIWAWNDFFNPLIYISSVAKYPLALGLRIDLDVGAAVSWDKVMAMSVVTMLPPILIFFFAQKYFVEGIATTGLKG